MPARSSPGSRKAPAPLCTLALPILVLMAACGAGSGAAADEEKAGRPPEPAPPAAEPAEAAGPSRDSGLPLPNIVVFLADDIGLGDTSAYQDWTGNSDARQIDTPAMADLARRGVRFTDAHAPASACSPTRYALLTGRYAWRTALKHNVLFGPSNPPLIEKGRRTLATMLKDAGYVTAVFGKWHLGLTYQSAGGMSAGVFRRDDLARPLLDGPVDHGFDYAWFTARSHWDSRAQGWFENRTAVNTAGDDPIVVDGYQMTQVGMESFAHMKSFLSAHVKGEGAGRPFFIYYPTHAAHTPYFASPEIDGIPVKGHGRYKRGKATSDRVDSIHEIDVALERTVRFLEESDDPRRPGHPLMENTLFIFTSDNGSNDDARESVGPLRGHKLTIWEGGHRVPFIAAWKAGGIGDGNPATAGSTSAALLGLNDMYATLAELTGHPLGPLGPEAEDSFSVLASLRGGEGHPEHPPLVLHDDKDLGPVLAIRKGRWKLVVSDQLIEHHVIVPVALFDLEENLSEDEAGNLVASPAQQERVKSLSGTLRTIFLSGHSR